MAELVETVDDVIENLLRYREALQQRKSVTDQFRQVQHWYCTPDPANPTTQLWGPAKFIGYKGMTDDIYTKLAREYVEDGGLHGSDAKRALSVLSLELDPDEPDHAERFRSLQADLRDWVAQFTSHEDKLLRSKYKIHVIRR